MIQQVYVTDASYYLDDCMELLFGVFIGAEVMDALKQSRIQLAAIAGDDVVGFLCYERAITYLYWDLKWMAVLPGQHRKGIGRMLVEHMKSQVILANGSHIRVETPSDSPALNFYKACGFEIASEYPDFYDAGRGVTTLLWRNPNYQTVQIEDDTE